MLAPAARTTPTRSPAWSTGWRVATEAIPLRRPRGHPRSRRSWPAVGLGERQPGAVVGLVDDAEARRHAPLVWAADHQPLLVVGAGQVTTDDLVDALLEAWSTAWPTGRVIDVSRSVDGALLGLDDNDHAHREGEATVPRLALVRRWHALAEDLTDLSSLQQRDRLLSRASEPGPVHLLVIAERAAGLPAALRGSARTVVLTLTDPTEYAAFGLSPPARPGPAGRGRLLDGSAVQLANRPRRARSNPGAGHAA